MTTETLDTLLDRLNKEYPDGKPYSQANRQLLRHADALATEAGKMIWLGVDGWYADLPENERR